MNSSVRCKVAVLLLGSLLAGWAAAAADPLPAIARDGSVTWLCYAEGGAMDGMQFGFVIDFERGATCILRNEKEVDAAAHVLPTDGLVACSAADWRLFSEWIDAADIPSWPDEFSNPLVCDGSVWELRLMNGTNLIRRIWRANDAPPKFRAFHRIFRKLAPQLAAVDYICGMGYSWEHGVEFRAKGSLEEAVRDAEQQKSRESADIAGARYRRSSPQWLKSIGPVSWTVVAVAVVVLVGALWQMLRRSGK